MIQSPAFYAEEGRHLRWFYWIDSNGRLYTEDILPKNIATSLKSPKFLDFFFRRLRPNDTGMHENYPYVSPCGKEMNFVRCADRPVVFHTLAADGRLEWGASLREEFHPASLSVCPHSGRMYHPCTSAARLGAEPGLLHAHVTARLAERLEEAPGGFLLSWDGRTVPVPFAPGSAVQ